jgi:N-acetylglutamate synthase-like GNAT family acetyltransferase
MPDLAALLPEPCTTELFNEVREKINEFELDDRGLVKEDFLTLSKSNHLLAFGRLKRYSGFSELCSLGVIQAVRHRGLTRKLVNALSQSCNTPIYLVSIIPHFFEELGFAICESYPSEIQEKLDFCTSSLVCDLPYVVMKRVS